MPKKLSYNEAADPADFAPDFKKNPEPYGRPVQEVIDCFSHLPIGSHIVDFAGGYGKYGMPLLKMGFDVTIVDIHQPSLDEARRRSDLLPDSSGKLRTINTDVLRDGMPNFPDRVDGVLSIGFMHHLTNDAAQNLFEDMTNRLSGVGLAVIEFSTDKHRRMPDGTPILVSGAPEHNLSYKEGLNFLKQLYENGQFTNIEYKIVTLKERQINFWYDAKMILASGEKKQL